MFRSHARFVPVLGVALLLWWAPTTRAADPDLGAGRLIVVGPATRDRGLTDSAEDVAEAVARQGLLLERSISDADVRLTVTARRRAPGGRIVFVNTAAGPVPVRVRVFEVVSVVELDGKSETLTGRHSRSWRRAAEDLVKQLDALLRR